MCFVHRFNIASIGTAILGAAVASVSAQAQAPDPVDETGRASFEGGVTVVGQTIDEDRVDDEVTVSLDFVTSIAVGPAELTVYVEGSTTAHPGDIAAEIPEANGDAGSAADRDDKGRFQVSELYLTWPAGDNALVAGLVDVTGYLDASDVANDETVQFLGATFVNNPTIEFPDYTLGVVYDGRISDRAGYVLALTSSNGLADNPDKSYSQLFDVSESGKGIFAGAEFHWVFENATLRVGIWRNTADHDEFNGASTDESNQGVYGVADWGLGAGMANVRLGLADEDISEAAGFVSFALEYPVRQAAVGLGVSQTMVSNEAQKLDPSLSDTTQAEIYARFEFTDRLHLTPSLQFIRNSGFRGDGAQVDDELILAGARATYSF